MSRLRWQLRSYIVGVDRRGRGLLRSRRSGPINSDRDLLIIAIFSSGDRREVWPVHLSLKASSPS